MTAIRTRRLPSVLPVRLACCVALLLLPLLPLAAQAGETGQVTPELQKERARAQLECADQVMAEVAALRGWQFKQPVKQDVRTRAELATYLAEVFQREYAGGKLERADAWLQTLGLLPKGRDLRTTLTEVLLTQIGGFYDPRQQSFFMMTEAVEFGDAANRMMIAHELCHALDDQYVDLQALQRPGRETTEDEDFVVGGVVEGSATALMFAWMVQAQKAGKVDLAVMGRMAAKQQADLKVLLAAPPYCLLLVANYMVGQHFITKGRGMAAMVAGDDNGGAILQVAKAMPRSMEQLLHPEKYWDAERRDEPVVLVNDAQLADLAAERTGLRVLHRNTLGELVAALVASAPDRKLNVALMPRADYWTNQAARGWGGDRLLLLGKEPLAEGVPVADAGVVWVTAWDTVADRGEFVAAVRKHRGDEPGFDLAEAGRVAVFGFGAGRRLGADGLRALLQAASFQQDGRPWSAEK